MGGCGSGWAPRTQGPAGAWQDPWDGCDGRVRRVCSVSASYRFTMLLFNCLLTFGSYFCFDIPSVLQQQFQGMSAGGTCWASIQAMQKGAEPARLL